MLDVMAIMFRYRLIIMENILIPLIHLEQVVAFRLGLTL